MTVQKANNRKDKSVLGIFLHSLYACVLMSVILGLVYPVITTGVCQVIFPDKANGSIITNEEGKAIGSAFIGQDFSSTGLFMCRPSAANYDAAASTGSNWSIANENQIKAINERAAFWRENGDTSMQIPADLLTASSSGMDPQISVKAALFQIPYVSKNTGVAPEKLKELIAAHTESRMFGGDDGYVNVLELNLDVQKLLK